MAWPVSEDEDERRVCVVLRRPAAGLVGLEQGEELQVGAEDEDKTQTVRWGKVVGGKGGKKEGVSEWVVEVEELTIESE
jgi:Tfp pilus assembly protein PilP